MTTLTMPMNTPKDLLVALRALHADVEAQAAEICQRWEQIPSVSAHATRRAFLISERNLAAYLALRATDLRELQDALQPLGVSSLGRAESHVIEQLKATISVLEVLAGEPRTMTPPTRTQFLRGDRLLKRHTDEVFGEMPTHGGRQVRIMVTFPTEAGDDYEFVRELVYRGMDAARINCAHDSEAVWSKMIAHIHHAEEEFNRDVLIHMDLAGPKCRTEAVIVPKGERLMQGDSLMLTRAAPKKPKKGKRKGGAPRYQAQIAIPAVLDQLSVGQEIWFDDGLMGTVIEEIFDDGALLNVRHVGPDGYKLKEGKGLNFPQTELKLNPLDEDDLAALDFICEQADSVGYSFVQTADDIRLLQDAIARRLGDRRPLAIVAKIETAVAVRELPNIIVAGAGAGAFAVMIARGDLAVEIGFERMAEIQEELLWLCEAAHVPVIWATQVLERFVKEGTPSRGEMTDAAASVRAECVMLNKGPYVAEAVTILDSLLTRMQTHLRKKTPHLRTLRAWANLLG